MNPSLNFSKKDILLVEPFYTGSHKRWADEFKLMSAHNVELLTLTGKHWKWRMEGGAIKLATLFKEHKYLPDLVLCTDMLNLPLFASLSGIDSIPKVLYMHENQICYPFSATDNEKRKNRDFHYSFINYTSCLIADEIWFNSNYHQSSFIEELPIFLNMFPDHKGKEHIDEIVRKSKVIPIGMDFDAMTPSKEIAKNKKPLILWNHRWEFDKNPSLFFETLCEFSEEGLNFNLVVLGEKTNSYPAVFDNIKSALSKELLHIGYSPSKATYYNWLWQSDILPVTSIQDFFGISTVEAIYCQNTPLLPYRLAYPEHIPSDDQAKVFYSSDQDFKAKLKRYIVDFPNTPFKVDRGFLERYHWKNVIKTMDSSISRMTES